MSTERERELGRIRNRRYREKNLERIRLRLREYKKKNRAKLNAQSKAQRLKNPEARRKTSHKYYVKNKRRIQTRLNEICRKRRASDPAYKMKIALKNRVNAALSGRAPKARRTMELLGCSTEELKLYLQSKFQDGMHWSNYGQGEGKWVVDHIIACARFNLLLESHQLACFNYKNLQPMWWKPNIIKSDSITLEQEEFIRSLA